MKVALVNVAVAVAVVIGRIVLLYDVTIMWKRRRSSGMRLERIILDQTDRVATTGTTMANAGNTLLLLVLVLVLLLVVARTIHTHAHTIDVGDIYKE